MMTREEFENSLLEYGTLDVDVQAERLVALVEAFAQALEDAALARQERDDVKEKYMRDFLESSKEEETALSDNALTDNGAEPEEKIELEEYMDLG